MGGWFWSHFNGIVDNITATALWTGGAALAASLKSLSIPIIIAISVAAGGVILFLIQVGLRLQVKHTVTKLLSIGVFTDVPVNLTRILYHDRGELIIGHPQVQTSEQDRLVYTELSYRNIVQLEQRRGRDNVDRGYWVLTALGKAVINYLDEHPQVLDKEGSLRR